MTVTFSSATTATFFFGAPDFVTVEDLSDFFFFGAAFSEDDEEPLSFATLVSSTVFSIFFSILSAAASVLSDFL